MGVFLYGKYAYLTFCLGLNPDFFLPLFKPSSKTENLTHYNSFSPL